MPRILRAVTEVTIGTTPTNDNGWAEIAFTGESLNADRSYTESAHITAHNQTVDLAPTGSVVNGAISAELHDSPMHDLMLASLFRQADWTTDVLKPGTTKKAFSIEVEFSENGLLYKQLKGMVANQGTFTFARGSIANQEVTFEGLTGTADVATSLVGGTGTSTAEASKSSFQTGAGITVIDVGGVTVGNEIQTVSFVINNNLQVNEAIGSDGRSETPFGAIQVTGTANFYLNATSALYYVDKLNDTESALIIRTVLPDASFREFKIAKLKWGEGNPTISDRNSTFMAPLAFTGLYDATELSSLTLTRSTPA